MSPLDGVSWYTAAFRCSATEPLTDVLSTLLNVFTENVGSDIHLNSNCPLWVYMVMHELPVINCLGYQVNVNHKHSPPHTPQILIVAIGSADLLVRE